MHRKAILAVTLATILIFSMTTSALAQEGTFSARILAKGSKSNILLIVINSSKSTQSIHGFEMKFTTGSPVVAIARGWNIDKNGDVMTFTAKQSDLGPGGKAIFIVRVSDPASSAFEWSAKSNSGIDLQTGKVTKIRIRESSKDSGSVLPNPITPEVSIDKVKATQGDQVTVTGKGYKANSAIILYVDQQEVGRSTTNAAGSFSAVVLISPNISSGLHLIKAVDSDNKSSVMQILIEAAASAGTGTGPPLEAGKLIVQLDKQEYDPGDLIRVKGSAVLDNGLSFQIIDPKGGIICGANPRIDNKTLLWDAICPLPGNSIAGRYTVDVKQIVHKTTATFTVRGTNTGGGTTTGSGGTPTENAGTLALRTDKEKYKVGETAQITVAGARAKSKIFITIIGSDGKVKLTAQPDVNEAGSITIPYSLAGAETGVWKISAQQRDAEQKKIFIVRGQFTVEA